MAPGGRPAFPDDVPDATLVRIWVIREAEEPGVLYAGTDPAALWRSDDGGESWQLNRGLWEVPTRPEWNPGAGVSACTRSAPGPGSRIASRSRISAAGVWLSDDRGKTWRTGYEGLVAALPARGRAAGNTRALRPQHAPRPASPGAPVPPVPRRCLPQRRRRRVLGRRRCRAPCRLRLSAGRRPGRSGQRVRHSAGRGRRPRHARRPPASLRDARQRDELDSTTAMAYPPTRPT